MGHSSPEVWLGSQVPRGASPFPRAFPLLPPTVQHRPGVRARGGSLHDYASGDRITKP